MRRRRHNPVKPMSALQWVLIGGVFYIAYRYLWPALRAASGAISSAAGAVTTPIANTYVALTSGPAIQAANQVMLPDGTDVPMQQIGATGTLKDTTQPDGTASATFIWNGVSYLIVGPADDTGTYYAQVVS